MVKKIRPKAEIHYCSGNDGRDESYDIVFFCPTCNRLIGTYKSDTACDNCGTFYDWGNKPPKIVVKREINWPIDEPVASCDISDFGNNDQYPYGKEYAFMNVRD